MTNCIIDFTFYPSDKQKNYTKKDILNDCDFLKQFLESELLVAVISSDIMLDTFELNEWDELPDEDYQCVCRFNVEFKISFDDFFIANKKKLQLFSGNPWKDGRTNSFGDFPSINIDIAEYDKDFLFELKQFWTLNQWHNLRSEITVHSFFEGTM